MFGFEVVRPCRVSGSGRGVPLNTFRILLEVALTQIKLDQNELALITRMVLSRKIHGPNYGALLLGLPKSIYKFGNFSNDDGN